MSEVKLGKSSEGRIYESKFREFGRLFKLPEYGKKIWQIFQITYVRSEKLADFKTYRTATRDLAEFVI
jgi:hypothetical protein